MTPLISICCVTYNQVNYIQQALDSFLMQQTNFDFEIIIHDDASNDGTAEIIRDYYLQHPNIIKPFFQKENQWSQGVRGMFIRFAFPHTKGKYIALCEGDDYWTDPLKLQKQVDFLEANEDFSLCFHDARVLVNEEEKHLYVNQEKTNFSTEDLFERHFIPTASIVFRNTIQVFPEWFAKIASGDKLLLFLLSLKGEIKYLKDEMSVYRLHSGGISNTHFGIKKVYDTSLLLHLINEMTNYRFTKKCHDGLMYEIKTHILMTNKNVEVYKNSLSEFKAIDLFKELFRRVVKKLK